MVSAFIDDGYTEIGHIAAVEGIYPMLQFRFRPVMAGEFTDYAQRINTANPSESKIHAAQMIVDHLVDWDVKRQDGSAVEVTTENVLKLRQPLYLRLFQVIIGDTACDSVPENEIKN